MADKDYAPGLPKKKDKGDLSKLRAGDMVDLVVQKHEAERAGTHRDWRIGDEDRGLYSWATKKELPKKKGEKIGLFPQPLHRHSYKDFEGEIKEGYGKGKVKKEDQGKVLITKVTDKTIHLTRADKRFPERFILAKPKDEEKPWLLINSTPAEAIPYEKIHYTSVHPDRAEKILDSLQPGSSVQAKLDGAASLTELLEKKLEVISYRKSKETGGPIIHTERIFGGIPETDVPKEYRGSVLRGEIYGTKDGKAIPPQELGGLLNSSVYKSLKSQREKGVQLRNMVFDVHQLGRTKDVQKLPYEERRKVLEKILAHLPKDKIHGPIEEAKDPESAKKLFHQIRMGEHPLTEEGVVIHRPHKNPVKVKFEDEHDVFITRFFPGEGKRSASIGGFYYSHEPGGPEVGKVGTGFSDETLADLGANQKLYAGRRARVKAQEKLPSGALRAPSFIGLHEDYPMAPVKKRR